MSSSFKAPARTSAAPKPPAPALAPPKPKRKLDGDDDALDDDDDDAGGTAPAPFKQLVRTSSSSFSAKPRGGGGGGFGAVFKAGSSNASRFGERAFTATPSSRLGQKNGGALHDPDAPDALVLRPAPDPDDPSGLPAIVMDPFLAAKLRPHQVEGVKFLYNALMGVKDASGAPNGLGRGSLLADDMGLGKTLQTIAIIYTMLSQPSRNKPEANNAIVICPTSLCWN